MNAERPAYEKREFYGPLELARDVPEIRYRHMLEHPDDPSKLIRTTDEGLYVDQYDMDEQVRITQQVLHDLKSHGINHVNPSYIDETSEDGEPCLLIVVDKLKDFEPYSKLIGSGNLTPEQIHEADLALGHMFDFLGQAMNENGHIDIEMMRLGQFVYDPSQPEGQKMVLVDVEPVGGREIDMAEDSMMRGYPSALATATAKLVADTVNLANKTGASVGSLQKAAEIIERLPGDSEQTNHMKSILLTALDNRELSQELVYYADASFFDQEDEDFFED